MKKIQNLVTDGMIIFIVMLAIGIIGSIVFAVFQCLTGGVINPSI
jgi:tryptophan-rich sensory protein